MAHLGSVARKVAEEPPAEEPGVALRHELRPPLSAEPADPRKVLDLEVLESVEKDVELERAEVGADDNVRVRAVDEGCGEAPQRQLSRSVVY